MPRRVTPAEKKPAPGSDKERIEDVLADAVALVCGTRPTCEHLFSEHREWRFDLAFPAQKLAVEVHGRWHLNHKQFQKDCEKLNAAKADGWTVLQYPASSVLAKCRRVLIVEQIYRVLCGVSDPEFDTDILTGKLS